VSAPKVEAAPDGGAYITYVSEPAPRLNPEGRLMGAWIIRMIETPCAHRPRCSRIVARFQYDGRDRAEGWLHTHKAPPVEVCKIHQVRQ
jgi:hypothetical protein